MQLSVIIVNYNVRYFLEQALLSVKAACEGIEAEVWVVDNHSVDGSVEMVRRRFPEVHLIENTENVGFAKANNQAIAKAKGAFVLLLNPDTVVEEDTFRQCLHFMQQHPEAGALGVRMIDGSGKFLPESKRGFPSPWVAFCKTFGLSRLFPKIPLFNQYHLGYLDENDIHEVDVLSGAFMFIRRKALDQSGWLDEAFFMYGEDIDLSYRLQQVGYKNYYFPHTKIIHYKGESTKKGSLNYVKTFYQAMIIFARKHFSGEKAGLFVLMLNMAIYLRAGLTLLEKLIRRLALPMVDTVLMVAGLAFLQQYWGQVRFGDPNYYGMVFWQISLPMYTLFWLGGIFFSGAYDQPFHLGRLSRGLFWGTLCLAAVYGFLDADYRSSRALILLGGVWTGISLTAFRLLWHFIQKGHFNLLTHRPRHLIIVGSQEESKRVRQLLQDAEVSHQFLGTVSPQLHYRPETYLSHLEVLDEVVQIYRVDEIIFCSRDLKTEQILEWMARLGPQYQYKILPENSLSIIGSHSRNMSGEMYTIDIQYRLDQPLQRRNKRLFDFAFGLGWILTLPLFFWVWPSLSSILRQWPAILIGKKTWVGYAQTRLPQEIPSLKPGLLSPADAIGSLKADEHTRRRLNYLYAKDYTVWRDVEIIWKWIRKKRA